MAATSDSFNAAAAAPQVRVRVRVRVTLQLTVSQSVCLGVEPNLGLLTRDFFFKLQSCLIWGALSDERSGLSFVSLQSVYSSQSVFT
jgi:hypothetical protein